jgi:hypothetical protein
MTLSQRFSEMKEAPMKPQKHTRLEVVALESRELLSTVMPESAPNNAKAAADVVRVGPTDGMAAVAVIPALNLDFSMFSADSSTNVQPGCSGTGQFPCKITNDTRSDENFAKRLQHKPDIPFVVIPTAETQATHAAVVSGPRTILQPTNDTHTRSDENFAKRLKHKPDIPFVVIPTAEKF